MTNEAFARVRIDVLLAARGRDTLDTNAVRFEANCPTAHALTMYWSTVTAVRCP